MSRRAQDPVDGPVSPAHSGGNGKSVSASSKGRCAVKSNVRALDPAELRSRLAVFEDRYGASSERLYDVFTVNGVLRETPDFLEWSFLYETLRDVTALSRS